MGPTGPRSPGSRVCGARGPGAEPRHRCLNCPRSSGGAATDACRFLRERWMSESSSPSAKWVCWEALGVLLGGGEGKRVRFMAGLVARGAGTPVSRLSPRPSLPADANVSSLHPGRGPGANVLTLGMSSAQTDKPLLVVTLGLSLVTPRALPIYADVRQKTVKSSIIILRCRQCYACLFPMREPWQILQYGFGMPLLQVACLPTAVCPSRRSKLIAEPPL